MKYCVIHIESTHQSGYILKAHDNYYCMLTTQVVVLTQEIFLQFFPDILKRMLQNIKEILKKCFLEINKLVLLSKCLLVKSN